MTDDAPRPRFLRRRLGARLRQLRENAQLKPKEAAGQMRISTATLSKIENGRQAVKPAYVLLMGPLYKIEQHQLDDLLLMAEESGRGGWLRPYSNVLRGDFRDYHEMEHVADTIYAHETAYVFGLLQTPDYVRALRRAAAPDSTEADLNASVELRRTRQARLTSDTPPTLHVVLDEAALRRKVGGSEVMREQLAYLTEVAELPTVTLQIVPFESGAYAAGGAAFVLLRYREDPELDVVYIENDCVANYLDRPREIKRYAEMFEQAAAGALSPEESIAFVVRVRGDV